MNLRIVTDSACDLPKDMLEDLEVLSLPLNLMSGEVEYRDKEDITSQELYKKIRAGEEFTTSQSSPDLVYERLTQELEAGRDIIYICFSSGLSGQYQMARMIVSDLRTRYLERKIEIIDSKAACTGMALMVKLAGEMAQAGASIEEIMPKLDSCVENIKHVILIDNMEYLYRGGRITRAQVLTGGLLNIKPIIGMDQEGRLEFVNKARGRKKLIKKTEELIRESVTGDLSEQTIGLVYGDNLEMAEEIKEFLISTFNPRGIIVENVGPTIASHTGPDIIGITFLKSNCN